LQETNLILFLTASMALIATPGPDMVYVLTRGVAQGRRAALVSACGVCSGLAVHTSFAAIGLSALLARSAVAFSLVRYAGAAYLIYLGVRAFRRDHVPFPRRVRSGPHQGELVWGDLQHHDVLRFFHNPCYAGAFVLGRTRTSKTADGRTHIAALPREEWQVVVRGPDAHPLVSSATIAPGWLIDVDPLSMI
jgi:hypothetical protein